MTTEKMQQALQEQVKNFSHYWEMGPKIEADEDHWQIRCGYRECGIWFIARTPQDIAFNVAQCDEYNPCQFGYKQALSNTLSKLL